ncbi:MAG TPA: hypothetical protein VJZ77_18930 [Blastocatellia bacterium]|nr:hypothetical protein [Blastocatellia bacterium]
MAGGLAWFALCLLVASEVERSWNPSAGALLFTLTNLCLMGGPMGLLILRAAGDGWKLRFGLTGACLTLLGQCSYIAGASYTFGAGKETGFVFASRALGALLVGVGMLMLGFATSMARQLPGWWRNAPLTVGLYYACMIPIQIIFFIIPKGSPSVTILAFWGLPWALLGWTIWSVARTPNAIHRSRTELIS